MNVEGLVIDVERSLDGVELAERAGKTVFRFRTERWDTRRITISDLENPVVVQFVNATDDERRRRFFTEYGLMTPADRGQLLQPLTDAGEPWHQRQTVQRTHRKEIHHETVLVNQKWFRALLWKAGSDDRAEAVADVNLFYETHPLLDLRPEFHLAGPRGAPQVSLRCTSFVGFMLMEAAMIAAHSARAHECEQCSTFFLTGPLTWRRAHAVYCSDRCRVAAMRSRKANI